MVQKVFSPQRGKYGGDQEYLFNLWKYGSNHQKEELLKLITKTTIKHVDTHDISRFLQKLQQEGCGFVAGVTIILAYYEKNHLQDKFTHDYGIDFYNTKGEINFAELLLLFYQQERYKRHLPLTTLQFFLPYPGVRASDLHINILRFSQQNGQTIKGKRLKNISKQLLREELAQGKIITLTCYFSKMSLISTRLDWYHHSQINFHTIMITGYDNNAAKFSVSSWGNKYYLAELPFYGTYYSY